MKKILMCVLIVLLLSSILFLKDKWIGEGNIQSADPLLLDYHSEPADRIYSHDEIDYLMENSPELFDGEWKNGEIVNGHIVYHDPFSFYAIGRNHRSIKIR